MPNLCPIVRTSLSHSVSVTTEKDSNISEKGIIIQVPILKDYIIGTKINYTYRRLLSFHLR